MTTLLASEIISVATLILCMQQPRVRLSRTARVEKTMVRTSQNVELLTITCTKRSQVVKKISSCSSVTFLAMMTES